MVTFARFPEIKSANKPRSVNIHCTESASASVSRLSDDDLLLVGMGKTIMLSALIQTNREAGSPDEKAAKPQKARQLRLNNSFRAVRQLPRPLKGPSANLIVAPTSLLSQWSEEIRRSSKPGTTKIAVWHGHNRLDLDAAIQDDHDKDETIKVVITSYGVLASEHAKSEKSSNGPSPIFESLSDSPVSLFITGLINTSS
jgi:DNA repair protein RAD5